MSQIFHPSTNTISRVSIFGSVFIVVGLVWLLGVYIRSPYVTRVGVAREQPVPFSHKHHVGGIGIDCRYCHTSVETTAFAGVPPTATCMSCHRQIWSEAPMLEPVRRSVRTERPLEWTRVHDLADFVRFDHSIHVGKGIGCQTCHGEVDRMPLTWRNASLFMEWCLDCHRHPERYVRPREEVFNADYEAPDDQLALGRRLVREYDIESPIHCSACHF